MRIGIDARFLTHHQRGGFKTYTENLTAALIQIDSDNEYVLYVDREPDADQPLPSGPNVTIAVVPGTLPLVGMPWREQVGLAVRASRDRLDLLHSLCLTAPLRLPCPLAVTIHDMIWATGTAAPKRSASLKSVVMEQYYRNVPAQATRQAAAVITVSQASKQSIVDTLGLPPERVFVTYEASDPRFRRIDRPAARVALREQYGLDGDYILALGSADPRKNVETLLEAYARLPQELRARYRLAIVWAHHLLADSLAARAAELGIADRLRFLQAVPSDDLVRLYNVAALFAFPSRYEGFGLPLLEAMACGTPVVAADNSSIPEIVGDSGLLLPAEDAGAFAEAMARVLMDEGLRARLIERGLARAASFSWQRCARETIGVYQRIVPQEIYGAAASRRG